MKLFFFHIVSWRHSSTLLVKKTNHIPSAIQNNMGNNSENIIILLFHFWLALAKKARNIMKALKVSGKSVGTMMSKVTLELQIHQDSSSHPSPVSAYLFSTLFCRSLLHVIGMMTIISHSQFNHFPRKESISFWFSSFGPGFWLVCPVPKPIPVSKRNELIYFE